MRISSHYIIVSAFLLFLIIFPYEYCQSQTTISGKNWILIVEQYLDNQNQLPISNGVQTILVPETHEGIILRGEIRSVEGDSSLVVNLKDFKLIVKGKENFPFGVEITRQKNAELVPVNWPKGHSDEFEKEDFPAKISIYYMVDRGTDKTFSFEDSEPLSLPFIK